MGPNVLAFEELASLQRSRTGAGAGSLRRGRQAELLHRRVGLQSLREAFGVRTGTFSTLRLASWRLTRLAVICRSPASPFVGFGGCSDSSWTFPPLTAFLTGPLPPFLGDASPSNLRLLSQLCCGVQYQRPWPKLLPVLDWGHFFFFTSF